MPVGVLSLKAAIFFIYSEDVATTKRLRDLNPRAYVAFAMGLIFTWLFLNGMVPALQGFAAQALGGLDLSWHTGGLVAGITYYLLARNSHKKWLDVQQEPAHTATDAREPAIAS